MEGRTHYSATPVTYVMQDRKPETKPNNPIVLPRHPHHALQVGPTALCNGGCSVDVCWDVRNCSAVIVEIAVLGVSV